MALTDEYVSKSDLAQLRSDINSDMEEISRKSHDEISELRQEMNRRFDSIGERFEDIANDVATLNKNMVLSNKWMEQQGQKMARVIYWIEKQG